MYYTAILSWGVMVIGMSKCENIVSQFWNINLGDFYYRKIHFIKYLKKAEKINPTFRLPAIFIGYVVVLQ